MRVCERCGIGLPAEAHFCPSCGFPVSGASLPRCQFCGAATLQESRFCYSCGRKISAATALDEAVSPSHPSDTPSPSIPSALQRHLPSEYVRKLVEGRGRMEGERRIVTILFCDVKGSTAMAEKLDPEEVVDIMNGAFDVLIEPIARYEGTLARLMGDAILAFFGAPLAHENDAERACRAALDILMGVRRYAVEVEERHGIPGFAVRVGINTGLVVVGEVGADLRVEYTAMGDAVNLAARMESLAEPGSILITEETYRIVSPLVKSRALGPVAVKGKQEPVHVFRLLGLRDKPVKDSLQKQSRLPLRGRETELQTITETLRLLREGKGARLAVAGDTGVGKTRLVMEARRSVRTDAAWIAGRASSLDVQSSFCLARQILRGVINSFSGGGADDAGAGEIGSLIEDLLPGQASEVRGPLSLLLGVSGQAGASDSPAARSAEPSPGRMAAAFRILFTAAAARRPIVILLDDFHWADQSSFELLHRLFPISEEAPILFVVLYRVSGERAEDFHRRCQLGETHRWTIVDLQPLDHDSSVLILRALLENVSMPEEARTRILENAEGNPFFLEEMARQIVESERADTRKPDGPTVLAMVRSLPPTLQSVIMARIDSLEPDDRRILQTASVLGRTFRQELLEQVVDSPGRDLNGSLHELLRRDFLRPVTADALHSDEESSPDEYTFAHALTHETAYSSLLLSRRRELHERAAESLLALHGAHSEKDADSLAYHFESAGRRDRAFPFLLTAAERNRILFANHEAIVCYEKALVFAEELGSDSETKRRIHEGLGDVTAVLSEYPRSLQHYELGRQCAQDPRRRAQLLRKIGEVSERTGRYDEAIRHFEAALNELRANFDTPEAALVYTGLGLVYYRRRDFRSAIELNMLALDLMTGSEDRRGIARILNNLGIAHSGAGDCARAEEVHQRALALWDELGDTRGRAASHNNLGMICSQQSRWDEAVEHFQGSLTLCERMGNFHGVARICDNLGDLYARRGDTATGMEYLQKAVTLLASIGSSSTDGMPEMWLQSGTW